MIKLLVSGILLGLSYLGFSFAFKQSDKDKAKIKLDEELSRSEVLDVKSEYLDVKASNNKQATQLSRKEKKIEDKP